MAHPKLYLNGVCRELKISPDQLRRLRERCETFPDPEAKGRYLIWEAAAIKDFAAANENYAALAVAGEGTVSGPREDEKFARKCAARLEAEAAAPPMCPTVKRLHEAGYNAHQVAAQTGRRLSEVQAFFEELPAQTRDEFDPRAVRARG